MKMMTLSQQWKQNQNKKHKAYNKEVFIPDKARLLADTFIDSQFNYVPVI